jgi:type VI secretion system protein ImpC
MARDKIGSSMEADDCEKWLNEWIINYVNSSKTSSAEVRAKKPLASARIEVKEVPGSPGSYNAIAYLQPWLQMEELTTSMRLVAKVPKKG